MKSPNKAGAGNGARALSFYVGHLGRAVPDLCRSPAGPGHEDRLVLFRKKAGVVVLGLCSD